MIPNESQRAFLSCDLCAQKMTESYYCPHCLAAYPAHYVKLHTRCTRCIMSSMYITIRKITALVLSQKKEADPKIPKKMFIYINVHFVFGHQILLV